MLIYSLVKQMRRQGQYADSTANPMLAAQMQYIDALRMQHNSGSNHFPGRPDTLHPDEEQAYISSKAGRGQWDRDEPKGPNPMSSHSYREGQGADASRSLFEGHKSDSKLALEKQAEKDPRTSTHEQDMEIGYEDTPIPQTFEGLEQKFLDDIMKLTKEQHDAEDEENARHRERMKEINAQYQEKLMAVRARQANHRDEFLRRESQIRQHQYQQREMSHYQSNAGPSEPHGYADAGLAEGHRSYAAAAAAHFDSYRERAQYLSGARNQGFESRGHYPGGRVYDSGARYY